jgi:hypothetical protein
MPTLSDMVAVRMVLVGCCNVAVAHEKHASQVAFGFLQSIEIQQRSVPRKAMTACVKIINAS